MKTIYAFFLLALCTMGLLSCEEEKDENLPDYELVIPSSAYSMTVTAVATEKESTVLAEPKFTNNFEVLGCHVKEAAYYIDNVLVKKVTATPFNLEYKTKTLRNGQHLLKAVFIVGGEGFKDATVECLKAFYLGDSSTSTQQAVKFNIDYDHYLRVGDKLHVGINMVDVYNAGYQIREVKYYFDNKLVSTKTEAPYDLDYSASLVVGKHYPLKVDISYFLSGSSSSSSHSLSASVSVLADDETRYLYVPDYSYNTHFCNGDLLSGKGLLYRGKGDSNIYELNLYWDDVLVGTSRTFPFNFSFTIKNASVGIHKLKREWKRFDKKGNIKDSQFQDETITVDK